MDQRQQARKQLEEELANHRGRRLPRQLRRRQVLAEAHDLFVERGYAGASMDELARRVGVSKPVIYDVGGSKEALFRDVMAEVEADLTRSVATAVLGQSEDRARLRAGILAFLTFVRDRGDAWAALLASDSGPPRAALEALQRREVELVAGLVSANVQDADPRTAQVVALAINGAVEFTARWWQEHPDIPVESLADLLTSAFVPDLFELSARSLV